ncbi:MAG: thiamine-phosphate kinase [Sphingobacteriia bacterium]|nr:thiamine-phosphate kinase [Sphingobacteriia bacterium]NCC39420.1 thiamine-phosphate kinase [Gammaproteobacteria bacterium]
MVARWSSASAPAGSEFDLIRRFFVGLGVPRPDVLLEIGDDCALLSVPADQSLAVSIDTLVAGTHFLADDDPESVGHKSLAVGLSDLAAMGATPAWATLALTLPRAEVDWIAAFARGFGALANAHGVRLVGGDTTRGHLSITVQVHGLLPADTAVRRGGARPGDRIWVSGTLGDAALALALRQGGGAPPDPWLSARLDRPTPRVALGRALRGLATAMIDLSDGLAADLGHILAASGVGAEIALEALPLSPLVAARIAERRQGADWSLALSSGDDYELCFCAPPGQDAAIRAISAALDCPLTPIGRIHAESGLSLRSPAGAILTLERDGYDHFSCDAA